MNNSKILFFIGKGGVGKSSVSGLTAIDLSLSNKKTLLISLDPAHNQCDIFEQQFSSKKISINNFLDVIEVDTEQSIKEYLKRTREKVSNIYSYQSSFNLQGYFKTLKFSPGIEEYALLHAFEKILKNNPKYDYYVFDMPPTALTLKFFFLPYITLIWTKELIKIRKEILKKKEIITKIKLITKEVEEDKVLIELYKINDRQEWLFSLLKSKKCIINLVANCDKLSNKEAERIIKKVKEINLHISNIILNKVKDNISFKNDFLNKSQLPIIKIPWNEDGLIGYDNISQFLKNNHLTNSILENG